MLRLLWRTHFLLPPPRSGGICQLLCEPTTEFGGWRQREVTCCHPPSCCVRPMARSRPHGAESLKSFTALTASQTQTRTKASRAAWKEQSCDKFSGTLCQPRSMLSSSPLWEEAQRRGQQHLVGSRSGVGNMWLIAPHRGHM